MAYDLTPDDKHYARQSLAGNLDRFADSATNAVRGIDSYVGDKMAKLASPGQVDPQQAQPAQALGSPIDLSMPANSPIRKGLDAYNQSNPATAFDRGAAARAGLSVAGGQLKENLSGIGDAIVDPLLSAGRFAHGLFGDARVAQAAIPENNSASTIGRPAVSTPVQSDNLVMRPQRGPLTGNPATDTADTRNWLATDDAWRKSQGQPTSTEFNKTLMNDFDRARGEQKNVVEPQPLTNPDIVSQRPQVGNKQEIINGNVMTRGGRNGVETYMPPPIAPDLWTPRTVAKQTITGYDKNENPIYDSGAATLAAINSGVTAHNQALANAYTADVNKYKTVMGGVPLDLAQAQEAGARAADVPVSSNRADRKLAQENQKYDLEQQKIDVLSRKSDEQNAIKSQHDSDANRLAQAKLLGGDEGGEAGLASTYDPMTPPPGPNASQVERSAFGAWQRHNATNISNEFAKGAKPQKIFDKYFSNASPDNQVSLIQMLPEELRGQIATMARDRYLRK